MKTRSDASGRSCFLACFLAPVYSLCRTGAPVALAATVLLLLTAGCADDKGEIDSSRNHLLDARQALKDGDSAKAIEALNASIASRPNVWAYFELAKLHLEGGDEAAALANCAKALELDPEMADALWFQGELKKPAESRFKGKFKDPPSANK
jgi:tetratricopeptide (TPR) repeat protein